MRTELQLPRDSAIELIQLVMEHLRDWPVKSAEAFRNAILSDGMLAINPLFDVDDGGVQFLKQLIRTTIAEGRMVDFGFIPNEVIKVESTRSRPMFEANEFQHPYETWLAVTSWEGGYNGYLICPHPYFPGETLVIELYGVSVPNVSDVIMIYDMVSVKVNGPGDTTVSPLRMDFSSEHVETEAELKLRGANSLDPLVTMLRLLADASIPITQRETPEKLNRARAKKGKGPLPGHTIVHTQDYVAQFQAAASGSKRYDKGGHHASPIAHWRRAHLRHLVDGRVIPVKSSKVNWRDAEELHRLFYRIEDKP